MTISRFGLFVATVSVLLQPVVSKADSIGFYNGICPGHGGACVVNESTGTNSLNVAAGGGQFSAVANGNAQPGSVGVLTSINLTNYHPDHPSTIVSDPSGFEGVGEAYSSASWLVDSLTINGLPSQFNVSVTLSVHGSFTPTNLTFIQSNIIAGADLCPPGLGVQCFSNNGLNGYLDINNRETIPSSWTQTFTNVTGNTFSFDLFAISDTSVAALTDPQAASSPNFVLTDSGSAQFGDTVGLTTVLFTDLNGNPIQGITTSSPGGFQLPLDPRNAASAVPEPTSVILSGLGIAALLAARRKKRSRGLFRCE